jgi:ComEC/Rec2-related protein
MSKFKECEKLSITMSNLIHILILLYILILTQIIINLKIDQKISKITQNLFSEDLFSAKNINRTEQSKNRLDVTQYKFSTQTPSTREKQNTVSREEQLSDTIKSNQKMLIDSRLNYKIFLIDSVLTRVKSLITVPANLIKAQEKTFILQLGITRGEFLWAMVFGNSKRLPSETRVQLKRVGLQHFLTISGFNLSLIILLAESLLGKIPYRRAFSFVLLLSLLIYIEVVGFSTVLLRSLAMICLAYIARRFFHRPFLPLYGFLFLTTIIILINPQIISNLSFQFSTAALVGIYNNVFLLSRFRQSSLIWKTFAQSGTLSLIVFCFISPLTAHHFSEINLLAAITNVCLSWTMPFLTGAGMVYCAFLLVSSGFGHILAGGLTVVLDIFLQLVTFFAKLPQITFLLIQPLPWWCCGVWWGSLIIVRQLLYNRMKFE